MSRAFFVLHLCHFDEHTGGMRVGAQEKSYTRDIQYKGYNRFDKISPLLALLPCSSVVEMTKASSSENTYASNSIICSARSSQLCCKAFS